MDRAGGNGVPGGRGPAGGGDVPGRRRVAQHLDTETLNAYLDGQLPPDERSAAAAHLAGCADCGQELAELRATKALLGGLPQYRPRRSFALGPEHAAVGRGGRSRLVRLLPLLPALRAATVVVALLLVAATAGDLILGEEGGGDSEPRSAVEAPAEPDAAGTGQPPETSSVLRAPTVGAPGAADAAMPPAGAQPAEDPAAGAGADAGLAEAQAPEEQPEAAEEAAGIAPRAGETTAGEVAPADDSAALSQSAPAPAASPPVRITAAAPTRAAAPGDEPDALAADVAATEAVVAAAPAPTGAAGDERRVGPAAASGEDGPSGWRLAQVALGLVLLWLLVTLVALARLRRQVGIG